MNACDCQFGHICDYHAEQQDRRRAERDAALEATLTHATVRGLARLRAAPRPVARLFESACGAEIKYALFEVVIDLENTIPTCPRCAVLRDAALDVATRNVVKPETQ